MKRGDIQSPNGLYALSFQHFREHLDKLFAKGIGMLDIALNEAFNILSDVRTSFTYLLRLRTIDGVCRTSRSGLFSVLRCSQSNRNKLEWYLCLVSALQSRLLSFCTEQMKGQGDESLGTAKHVGGR